MTQPNGLNSLRVGAAGDLHCREDDREALERALAELSTRVDLVLLAGDLTAHGQPAEAAALAQACRGIEPPVIAVLGNHDWHGGHRDEVVDVLAGAGITVLDRGWTVCNLDGRDVGVVGTKGFVGGFTGSHLPDFGEPLLRSIYAETSAEVQALDEGLREVALCPVRIVVLHYSPTSGTLEGEPPGIFAFLGSDRLAAPIVEHEPDLVLHGHAHAGTFETAIGRTPVYNVSVPVMGHDFWIFEVAGRESATAPIH